MLIQKHFLFWEIDRIVSSNSSSSSIRDNGRDVAESVVCLPPSGLFNIRIDALSFSSLISRILTRGHVCGLDYPNPAMIDDDFVMSASIL